MYKGTALMMAMAMPAFAAQAAPTVEVHGALDTDMYMLNDYAGGSTTDIIVSTMSLGFDASINSMVDAHIVFLYEEDATDPPVMDEGYLNLNAGNSTYTAGHMFVPFGAFETNMLSFPLTQQMAETKESVFMWGSDSNGLASSVYVFNGDAEEMAANNDDTLSYGLSLGMAQEGRFSAGVGYISNFADSNAMQELGMIDAPIAGANAYLSWNSGTFSLNIEHISALDSLVAGDFGGLITADTKPSSNHVEVAFEGAGGAILAFSYQTTSDAAFTGLPETATAAVLSTEIFNGASLGFEYMTMDDYAVVDGGTGKSADLYTIRLGVEF